MVDWRPRFRGWLSKKTPTQFCFLLHQIKSWNKTQQSHVFNGAGLTSYGTLFVLQNWSLYPPKCLPPPHHQMVGSSPWNMPQTQLYSSVITQICYFGHQSSTLLQRIYEEKNKHLRFSLTINIKPKTCNLMRRRPKCLNTAELVTYEESNTITVQTTAEDIYSWVK